jgi:hypothetical protein
MVKKARQIEVCPLDLERLAYRLTAIVLFDLMAGWPRLPGESLH